MSFLQHPVRWTLVPYLLVSAAGAWFLDTRTPLATIPSWLVAANLCALPVWWIDKLQARAQRLRVPESSLHLISTAGAAPAALLAMSWIRHKTRKPAFWILNVVLTLGWLIFLLWIYAPPLEGSAA